MSLTVPSKDTTPSRLPLRSPYVQRKMFHFQSLLLRIFISPQQRSPPSRFPSQSSHRETHALSRAFFYLSLKVPGEEVPLPRSPTGPPWREMPVTRAFFYISFKGPGKGAPSFRFSHASPPEPSFTCLSKAPVKESLLQVPPAGPLWRETPIPEPSFTFLSDT
jgi:hypothetical protein